MPETTAQRSAAAKKGAATRKRHEAEHKAASAVDQTRELSEEVLQSVEAGQRAAIDAVRKFVDTVDKTLPQPESGPSKRREVVDAAMEMANRLVHIEYDFLRKVVDSAGKSLTGSDNGK